MTFVDAWILLNKQKISTALLFTLLLLRFSGYFLSKLWGDYQTFYYVLTTFPLLVIVIWLNRDNLQSLHIDRPFILIFILLGILLSIYFGLSILSLISIAGALFIFILFITNSLKFENPQQRQHWILVTLVGIFPVLLFRLLYPGLSFFMQTTEFNTYDAGWLLTYRLWGVVYEEMIFRGMLWMFLAGLNMKDKNIFLVQALLFWVAHYDSLPRLSFWTIIPLISFWFGRLILHSKSLTPSTITHFFYNFTADLIRLTR